MAESDRPGASPSAAQLLIAAEDAARLGEERVASAAIDLFLPAHSRLSDYQRITAGRLFDLLVAGIETELRAALTPALREVAALETVAAVAAARMPIAAPILARAGSLRDPELIAILLRRADEHRLTMALRLGHDDDPAPPLFERWLRSGDPDIVAAARGLLIADSRRIGTAQEPLIDRAELPVDLRRRLVWRIAAALRHDLIGERGVAERDADRLLTAAAAVATAIDGNEAAAARAAALVALLGDACDDAVLLAAIEQGYPLLAAAGLARRARIAADDAADMMFDPGAARFALLVRAGDVAQAPAAAMLLRVALAIGDDAAAAADRIDALAALSIDQAQAATHRWRIDRDYRAAIARLDAGLAAGAADRADP